MSIQDKIEELESLKDDMEAKIEALKKEFEEERRSETEYPGSWKPVYNDIYYTIEANGDVSAGDWIDSKWDEEAYSIGNIFKTREEAEFMSERLKVIHELKSYARPFRFGVRNWFIYYYDDEIKVSDYENCKDDNLYFESEGIAEQAIEEIGEERIKKYYLQLEE